MKSANSRNPAATQERILDAAEALFAEHGFTATGLRMITAQAEVNLAAVNYHFGSKEALLQQVFQRRLGWLNSERLARLEILEAATEDGVLAPARILEAFFGPALELAADRAQGGRAFMRLLGRTYADPADFIRRFLAEGSAETLERFRAALVRALPGVSEEEILWRLMFMLGAMSYAIVGTETLRLALGLAVPAEGGEAGALGPRLMSFLLGGMRAPIPRGEDREPA